MPKSNTSDLSQWTIRGGTVGGTNVLGLVTLSIITGIIIGQLNRDNRPMLLTVFNDFSEFTLRVTGYVIKFTPIGVAFLVMPRIIGVEDAGQLFRSLGFFTLLIIIGLSIHGFLILPAIYYSITKKNPYRFIVNMSEALLTAFGTASSTATLPASIACLEEKNKINRHVVRFVVPIGATINMDGTALYEAVAAIFIAQSRDVNMDFARVLIVSITATAASIGAAGIPQVNIPCQVIFVLFYITCPVGWSDYYGHSVERTWIACRRHIAGFHHRLACGPIPYFHQRARRCFRIGSGRTFEHGRFEGIRE